MLKSEGPERGTFPRIKHLPTPHLYLAEHSRNINIKILGIIRLPPNNTFVLHLQLLTHPICMLLNQMPTKNFYVSKNRTFPPLTDAEHTTEMLLICVVRWGKKTGW